MSILVAVVALVIPFNSNQTSYIYVVMTFAFHQYDASERQNQISCMHFTSDDIINQSKLT